MKKDKKSNLEKNLDDVKKQFEIMKLALQEINHANKQINSALANHKK